MIAVTPLLHEIIPHGWTGMALLDPDGTMSSSTYGEHPGTVPLYASASGNSWMILRAHYLYGRLEKYRPMV
jgi:hypothetical protein